MYQHADINKNNKQVTPVNNFFGGTKTAATATFIQPKLTINNPNDEYEREADTMADKVMRMQQPSIQAEPLPISSVQRKCAHCEEEEKKAQRKEMNGSEPTAVNSLFFQPKLTINNPNDEYEKQADEMADKVMRMPQPFVQAKPLPVSFVQRKCTHCEEEDKKVQRKEMNGNGSADGHSLESYVGNLNGGGQSLPTEVRNFYEPRFGYDFSNVRVHSDIVAAKSAESINAHAYTNGSNIVFNQGQYAPETESGKRLLAHELTHVIQQGQANSDTNVIHRYSFGPQEKEARNGRVIHSRVLPLFVRDSGNKGLFIEAPIPGSNKKDADTGKKGQVDFYRTEIKEPTGRTMGVQITGNGLPGFLSSGGELQANIAGYIHNSMCAPRGTSGKKKKISHLQIAPPNIFLGDLKPGHSSEEYLSHDQLRNYKTGINNTARSVNHFKATNKAAAFNMEPDEEQQTEAPDWSPKVENLSSLAIPPVLEYGPNKNGLDGPRPLAVYLGETKEVFNSSLSGGMFVYKSPVSGIWSYEWFPWNVQAQQNIGHHKVDTALKRLKTEIIPLLQAKSKPGYRVQRKKVASPSAFDMDNWNKEYGNWKTESGKVLKEKDVEKQSKISLAMDDLSHRVPGNKFTPPPKATETAKSLKKIDKWIDRGSFYARMRKLFGSVYVKVSGALTGFAAKLKKIFGAKEPDTKGDRIIIQVAKTLFTVLKTYFKIVLGRVGEGMKESLLEGSKNIVHELFSETLGEQYLGSIAEINEFIEKMQNYKEETFVKPVEDWIEKNNGLLKLWDQIKDVLADARSITQKVQWAIRAVQCVTPPVTGCIKLLFSALNNYLISRAVSSCWFQKEVYLPAFNALSFFKELPGRIIDFLIEKGNSFVPLPAFIKNKLFATRPTVASEMREIDLPCKDEERIREVNLAFARLEEKYTKQRVDLLLQILKKEKVSEGTEMGLEQIAKLDKALDDLKDVSDATFLETLYYNPDPDNKQLVGLREFVDGMKAYDQAVFTFENPAKLDKFYYVVHPDTFRNGKADMSISDVQGCSDWNELMRIRVAVRETGREKKNDKVIKINYQLLEKVEFELGGKQMIDKPMTWGYKPDAMKLRCPWHKKKKK